MISLNRMKLFWIMGAFFGLVFAVLFSIRLDLLNTIFPDTSSTSALSESIVTERDTWMNISQNGRKIGFSHTTFSKKENQYVLKEIVFMRINTLGMIHDINLKTGGILNPDFTLTSFDFELSSERFSFSAKGSFSDNVLSITTQSAGASRTVNVSVKNKPYLAAGVIDAVHAAGLKTGDTLTFNVFDPATMGQESLVARVVGQEDILSMGRMHKARVLSLSFKGMTQQAWIGEDGEVLKEEGLLGISLEKTTREDAIFGLPVEASQDLTEIVSVSSNVLIHDAESLDRLKVELGGIIYENVDLVGGRQSLKDNVLTIRKESLSGLPPGFDVNKLQEAEKKLLEPTPFIQSDHHKILTLAQKIVSGNDTPLKKIKKLVSWIHDHIEKRPVISLPDALSTLENRVGDCNEHAVLLAALARAAGIPSMVETGLVYLNGKFFYHAWNIVYIGRWITADSLFGQVPADVTHIRFSGGTPAQQLDLMNIIGKVTLKVIQ